MSRISFLIPHKKMISVIENAMKNQRFIPIDYCTLDKRLESARKLIRQGYEILITRAGTAALIKKSDLPCTVVEIPITGFDIIRAVEKAKRYGSHIAVVTYPSMVIGIECLAPILGVDLRPYYLHSDEETEPMVLKAFHEQADVILGGAVSLQMAERHGLPAVFIESGEEGILQAVQEALHLEQTLAIEKEKNGLFKVVIDYVHDGIITVDRDCRITIINEIAQSMLHIKTTDFIGQPVDKLWPDLKLPEIMAACKEDVGELLTVRGLKVLCSKVPIIVNGISTGLVIAFQDITKIQQNEAHIRKEIYVKGHVAKFTFEDVWGNSPLILQTKQLAKEFAITESNILIVGKTGTGKEVFAQSIHNFSTRKNGPFVAINCAALPGEILESELFGYVGGAFTGANKEGKAGLFELAHGGTIFLDEIAEMDYKNQSRLLRVLQERSVMRLGSNRVISVDVRVIAATNKDLKKLMKENAFREDLFFRLNVLRLNLPPLQDRKQDISEYARKFLQKRYMNSGDSPFQIEPSTLKLLEEYEWPGNIRELQNVMERILARRPDKIITDEHIIPSLEDWNDAPSLHTVILNREKEQIIAALTEVNGIQSKAATLLGIDRSTLSRKMRRLGIKKN